MNKQTIGGIVLALAGILLEAILQLHIISFVKELIDRIPVVFNQATALSVMGVGILTVLASLRSKGDSEGASSSGIPQSASSVQNSGNVTQTAGDLHFHLPSYPTPQLSQPTLSPQTMIANPPLIEVKEVRSATVLLVPHEHWDKWSEHPAGRKAQIIAFRNRHANIGQERRTATEVVARLVYTASNEPSLEINAGCWLNEATQDVNMKPGEVAKLVVAVAVKGGEFLGALHNPRESLPILVGRRVAREFRVPSIQLLEIPGIPCKVEIALISENVTLYHGVFELRQGTERAMQLDPIA